MTSQSTTIIQLFRPREARPKVVESEAFRSDFIFARTQWFAHGCEICSN